MPTRWCARLKKSPRSLKKTENARWIWFFDGSSRAHDPAQRASVGALGGARRIEPLVPGSAWAPGWGIDEPRASVWLEDGQEIALAKTPLLLRVLVVLADHGGAATKEALVMEAWGERDYHPLRHDARMQMAIRKLREKIEHDPSSPTRLLTTADGYALAGQVRRVRLS